MTQIPLNHKLFIIGDYHQNSDILTKNLNDIAALNQLASVIFLGDYDVHSASDLSNFIGLLNNYNICFYLLRGNHDNPLYWQDRDIAALFETERIKLLKDIDFIQWNEKRILTISGAISVDRTCIRYDQGNCWPKIEGIPKDAMERVKQAVKEDGNFDTLLSHTGPMENATIKNAFTESFASTDETLLHDMKNERKLITQLQIVSGVRSHYFGHFHQKWRGAEYDIQMQCLNICECIEL